MPRYDKELVKSAAAGRWGDILQSLGGVSPDILDGRQHPCPKLCFSDNGKPPGGEDRFRVLDDFSKTGAVFCNRCFSSKNGDGFAALQWLTGKDFGAVLDLVAKHVGVQPSTKKAKPDDHLEFLPWNRIGAHLWCEKKPPITVEALERLGAICANYRRDYSVIAIPVWGPMLDAEDPVGYVIYRRDGGMLPKYSNKKTDWAKVLLTAGSHQGVITCLDDWRAIGTESAPSQWWKLEGSTDLLAAMSVQWPAGHAFFTTANGAGEKPLDWILKSLEGCAVNVCHDADDPGQAGATWVQQGSAKRAGWCPSLAELSAPVRNVCLPFPVERVKGPDIRDFIGGGGTPERLLEIAAGADDWSIKPEKELRSGGILIIDNDADQGVRLRAVTDMLIASKRVFRREFGLVSFDEQYVPRIYSIENTDGFAGFMAEICEPRNQNDKPLQCFPKPLASCWLNNQKEQMRLDKIDMLTLIPVYNEDWELTQPGLAGGIYYSGETIEPREGTEHIDRLLAEFCFHSPADRTNFIAMLLTCVLMPHFTLVEKPGVLLNGNQPGIGKSELAQVLATIKQGSDTETCTYNPNDEEFEKSLGSLIDNANNTTIVIDNVKSRKKIESACLERSITDSLLSFRRLKTSDRIKMRNNHLFVITANATEVSTDISSRCTLVGLYYEGDPKSRKFGLDSPKRYAVEHRREIIGELLGMVERWLAAGRPAGTESARFAVWAKIVGGILHCVGEPDFLGNVGELNELDSTQAEFAELVRAMYEHETAGSWTPKELVELAERDGLFRSLFGNKNPRGKQTAMGTVAGRFKNSVFNVDGVQVKFSKLDQGRSACYRVFDIADSSNFVQHELI